jgi:hypothetical protein
MIKRFGTARITALGLLLAAQPVVMAQVTTGQVSGIVTDAFGRPLRAIIVLTAPQLMGQRVIMTDARGEWRALLLPPGAYTIKIQADGYIGATIRNFRVGVGQSLRQNNILRAVTVSSATVEITGHDVATFDKTDTKTSVNYSHERLIQLGGDLNFWSAASMTPGVVMSGGNPVIRGGQVNSVNFRLDGADIKDPHQGTVDAVWYVGDSIEDIQVVLSPLNARYGRTLGGSINMARKSGGNEFGGSVRANIDRDSWRGRARDIREDEGREGGNVSDAFSRTWDVTLSGPVWKDHVWFMFGTSITPARVENSTLIAQNERYRRTILTGDTRIDNLLAVDSDFNVTPGVIQQIPKLSGYCIPFWDALQSYDSTQNNKFYEGKVTVALNENHRISFGGSRQEWEFDRSGSNSYLRLAQSGPDSYMAQGWNIGYDGVLGEKTFVETRVYRNRQWNKWGRGDIKADPTYTPVELWLSDNEMDGPPNPPNPPNPPTPEPSLNYVGRFAGLGGGSLNERNSLNASVNLTMFRDFWHLSHNIDVGVDYYMSDVRDGSRHGQNNRIVSIGGIYEEKDKDGDWLFPTILWRAPGLFGQSENGNNGLAPVMWQYYGVDGFVKNTDAAIYINDQITINSRWNIMLGLRFDQIKSENTDGSAIFSTNNFSPRFVLTYDVLGESSRVFKFSYNRMQSDYPQSFTNNFADTLVRKYVKLVWTGLPGQPIPGEGFDGGMFGLRFVTLPELIDINNYGRAQEYYDSSVQYIRDLNLKPMYNDEFALEYRRTYSSGKYIRLAYVYRKEGNIWGGSHDYLPDNWVPILDPSNGKYPLDNDAHQMLGQTHVYFNTDELWRDYHGVELESAGRINSIFSWNFSYSYSRLRGNSEAGDSYSSFGNFAPPGYFMLKSYFERPDINVSMDQRSPGGALINDYPHKVRASLLAVVPVAKSGWISYAAIFNYDAGANWTPTYPASLELLRKEYNALRLEALAFNKPLPPSPPSTWTKFYSQRGAYHANDTYSLNLRIAWEIPVWNRVKAMGDLSIYNVFNKIQEYSYNTEFVPNSVGLDSLYLLGERFGRSRNAEGLEAYATLPRQIYVSAGIKF